MATIRLLVTVCTVFLAGLTLTLGSGGLAPAAAQTTAEAPPGRPLNLLPHLGKTKKFSRQARAPSRVAKSRTSHRVAQRRGTTARTFARRQNARAVASREDESSATPEQESLGYQSEGAESKAQPPVDAWLRAPLPARAPATARPPAAPTGDQIGTTAETISAEPFIADASTAEALTVDLASADTVRVADAGEINEIDLAANETPAFAAKETPAPASKSWLAGLLAVLGGAFAAAAAAGFLFARGRKSKFRRSYA